MTIKRRQPAAKRRDNLRPHYSGSLSQQFWDLVQTADRRSPEQGIYCLACILESLEATTLARIQAALGKAGRK